MRRIQYGHRLVRLFFIIGWILILVIGYKEACFYKKYMLEEGYLYLGMISGRKIYANQFYNDNLNQMLFSIKVDDKPVYIEIDYNKDGKAEDIIHCEEGHEAYSTHYEPATGILYSRNVEYYLNGQHELTVVDARLNGDFVLRIKYLDKGGKSFEETKKIMEIFVNNKWTELKKEKGSYGYYNDEGTFIPIKYNKGEWEIIRDKNSDE